MATKNYCECGRIATRFEPDRYTDYRGRPIIMAFCPECPTPTEIDTAAAEVRETWPMWRRKKARLDDEMHGSLDYSRLFSLPID